MRLMFILLLFLASAASADIYRWTDADGNVVFGDNPPEGVDARRIQVREPMTVPALPESRDILERRRDDPRAAVMPYQHLAISSPGDDEPVRANDGNFSVKVDIQPELHVARGHRLRLIMDGRVVDTRETTRFDLVNVDRGTHRIQVQVLDRSERIIQESAPVEFHLLRHAIRRGNP